MIGTPPDRLRWSSPAIDLEVQLDGTAWFTGPATTVVIATGQFLRGLDVAPRGHPGDGKAEVQVYELDPPRAAPDARPARHRRARSASPNPVSAPPDPWSSPRPASPLALEVDGVARPPRPDARDRPPPGRRSGS